MKVKTLDIIGFWPFCFIIEFHMIAFSVVKNVVEILCSSICSFNISYYIFKINYMGIKEDCYNSPNYEEKIRFDIK